MRENPDFKMTDAARERLVIKPDLDFDLEVIQSGIRSPMTGEIVTIRYSSTLVSSGLLNGQVIARDQEMKFVYDSSDVLKCISKLVGEVGLNGVGRVRCVPDHLFAPAPANEAKNKVTLDYYIEVVKIQPREKKTETVL